VNSSPFHSATILRYRDRAFHDEEGSICVLAYSLVHGGVLCRAPAAMKWERRTFHPCDDSSSPDRMCKTGSLAKEHLAHADCRRPTDGRADPRMGRSLNVSNVLSMLTTEVGDCSGSRQAFRQFTVEP